MCIPTAVVFSYIRAFMVGDILIEILYDDIEINCLKYNQAHILFYV